MDMGNSSRSGLRVRRRGVAGVEGQELGNRIKAEAGNLGSAVGRAEVKI